jgi:hypothetical protein
VNSILSRSSRKDRIWSTWLDQRADTAGSNRSCSAASTQINIKWDILGKFTIIGILDIERSVTMDGNYGGIEPAKTECSTNPTRSDPQSTSQDKASFCEQIGVTAL